MTEKDLDIAIEKCERIMEFDTRTLENPESENGHIFEKVYDLLQFLRQLQFATDTNVGGNLIDRQAALDAIKKLEKPAPTAQHLSAIFDCEDTIKALPSAQPDVSDTNVGKICEYYDLCRNGRDEKKLREELLSAQPGWIPCSCELPKPNEEDGNGFYKAYLVQDGRWMDVARWDGKYWIAWGYSTVLLNVVAWCELPEPYREGGHNA